MKTEAKPVIGLMLCLCFAAFALTGCGLFGPSVQKAQEIAEQRQDEVNRAVAAFEKAEKDLADVVSKYEAAVSAGDTTAAQQLAIAVKEAIARYASAKEVVDSSKAVFEAAVQDFKNAKSASDYVGTVLGWLGMLFGAGGIGKAFMSGRKLNSAREGLEGATNMVEKLKSGHKWPEVLVSATAGLSEAAKKEIEHARP